MMKDDDQHAEQLRISNSAPNSAPPSAWHNTWFTRPDDLTPGQTRKAAFAVDGVWRLQGVTVATDQLTRGELVGSLEVVWVSVRVAGSEILGCPLVYLDPRGPNVGDVNCVIAGSLEVVTSWPLPRIPWWRWIKRWKRRRWLASEPPPVQAPGICVTGEAVT